MNMKHKALAAVSLAILFTILTLTSIGLASLLATAQYPNLSKEAMK